MFNTAAIQYSPQHCLVYAIDTAIGPGEDRDQVGHHPPPHHTHRHQVMATMKQELSIMTDSFKQFQVKHITHTL